MLGFLKLFPSKKRVVKILRDVSGIVKPSRYNILYYLLICFADK